VTKVMKKKVAKQKVLTVLQELKINKKLDAMEEQLDNINAALDCLQDTLEVLKEGKKGPFRHGAIADAFLVLSVQEKELRRAEKWAQMLMRDLELKLEKGVGLRRGQRPGDLAHAPTPVCGFSF
jgi:hypothetical protein